MNSLTLLQRGMLEHLRDAKCPELSTLARASWRDGKHAPEHYRDTQTGYEEHIPPFLLADFRKANEQVDADA